MHILPSCNLASDELMYMIEYDVLKCWLLIEYDVLKCWLLIEYDFLKCWLLIEYDVLKTWLSQILRGLIVLNFLTQSLPNGLCTVGVDS